jgi:hypothetical protein
MSLDCGISQIPAAVANCHIQAIQAIPKPMSLPSVLLMQRLIETTARRLCAPLSLHSALPFPLLHSLLITTVFSLSDIPLILSQFLPSPLQG